MSASELPLEAVAQDVLEGTRRPEPQRPITAKARDPQVAVIDRVLQENADREKQMRTWLGSDHNSGVLSSIPGATELSLSGIDRPDAPSTLTASDTQSVIGPAGSPPIFETTPSADSFAGVIPPGTPQLFTTVPSASPPSIVPDSHGPEFSTVPELQGNRHRKTPGIPAQRDGLTHSSGRATLAPTGKHTVLFMTDRMPDSVDRQAASLVAGAGAADRLNNHVVILARENRRPSQYAVPLRETVDMAALDPRNGQRNIFTIRPGSSVPEAARSTLAATLTANDLVVVSGVPIPNAPAIREQVGPSVRVVYDASGLVTRREKEIASRGGTRRDIDFEALAGYDGIVTPSVGGLPRILNDGLRRRGSSRPVEITVVEDLDFAIISGRRTAGAEELAAFDAKWAEAVQLQTTRLQRQDLERTPRMDHDFGR